MLIPALLKTTPWHVLNRILAGQAVGKSYPGILFLEKLHINNHEPLAISASSQFLVKALLKITLLSGK